jgi:pyruvate kinase
MMYRSRCFWRKNLFKKGINLPDTKISLPALTEKDLVDLDFIIDQNLDWVALSFVRSVKDLIILRNKLQERKSKAKIIAKIEKPGGTD